MQFLCYPNGYYQLSPVKYLLLTTNPVRRSAEWGGISSVLLKRFLKGKDCGRAGHVKEVPLRTYVFCQWSSWIDIHRHGQVFHSHLGEWLGCLSWAKTPSFHSFLQLYLRYVHWNVPTLTCQEMLLSFISPILATHREEKNKQPPKYLLRDPLRNFCTTGSSEKELCTAQAPACCTDGGGRSWAMAAEGKNATLRFNFCRRWKILHNTD